MTKEDHLKIGTKVENDLIDENKNGNVGHFSRLNGKNRFFFHFVIENLLHVEDQSHKWRQMGLYTYCERYVHEIAITLNPKTHSQNWILLGFQLHTYTVVQL